MDILLPIFVSYGSILKLILWLFIILIPAVGLGEIITFRFKTVSIFERFVLAAAIGFMILTLVIFLLCAMHICHPGMIRVAIIITAIVFLPVFYGVARRLLVNMCETCRSLAPIDKVIIIILAIALMYPFVNALMPPTAWDALTYHLEIPKEYLAHNGFVKIPYNTYSDMPLNVQMLYTLSLASGEPRLPQMLHFSIGLLLVMAIFGFTKRHYSTRAGILASVLFLAAPVILWEMGIAYVDIAMALFFFLLVISVKQWLRGGQRTWLILSGLFAGYMCGIKYTGIGYVAMLGGLVFLKTLLTQRHMVAQRVKGISLIALVAIVVFSPWMVKNYLFTGNPLFPALFGQLGGKELTLTVYEQLLSFHQNIGMGRGIQERAMALFNVFFRGGEEYAKFGGRLSPAPLVCAMLALFTGRLRSMKNEFFILAVCLFYLWFQGSQQIRFLLPIIPLLSISGASLVSSYKRKKSIGTFRSQFIGLIILVVLIRAFLYLSARMDKEISLRYLFGQETSEEYVARMFPARKAFKKLEQLTPEDETCLLLFENRGYYLDRPYIADSNFYASYFADLAATTKTPEQFRQSIRALGVRYVLVNNEILLGAAKDLEEGIAFDRPELATRALTGIGIIQRFLESESTQVYTENKISIHKITKVKQSK